MYHVKVRALQSESGYPENNTEYMSAKILMIVHLNHVVNLSYDLRLFVQVELTNHRFRNIFYFQSFIHLHIQNFLNNDNVIIQMYFADTF